MSRDRDAGVVVVYSLLGCPHSMRAKQLLGKANIPYTDVSIDTFPQCQTEVIKRAKGDTTLPQIFFDDLHIGGTEKLQSLLDDEKAWDDLMESMAERQAGEGPPLPPPTTAIDYNDNTENTDKTAPWMPDEYIKLIAEMRKANLIRDNKVGILKTYRNSFKGSDLIEWIVHEKGLDRKEALEIGQDLLDRRFGQQTSKEMGTSFSPDRYYQLVEDDDNRPLNFGLPECTGTMSPQQFNDQLVGIVEPVFRDILVDEGTTVRYHCLVDNDHYARYLQYAKELHIVDPSLGSPDERMAMLVNVYNLMLIHMTHKYGPPQSVWQRRKFLNSTYYQIHEHKYSLQSILNGILRSNKRGLGMLWKSFGKQDERLPLILPECEPLVHFALTTGTRSTPPVRVYTTKNIRKEMRSNAHTYLSNDENMKVDCKKNTLLLTKIFKWYADDFGGTAEKVIEWILDIFEEDESEKAKSLRKMFYTGDYSIDYLTYDWTFNGKEKPKEIRLDEVQSKPTDKPQHDKLANFEETQTPQIMT